MLYWCVMAPATGLAQRDLDLVREILERNGVTTANQPVIFGSRATGRARRYSDLDVCFAGRPLGPRQLRRLREELDESRLPIRVDVLNLADASIGLREHALEDAVALADAVGGAG